MSLFGRKEESASSASAEIVVSKTGGDVDTIVSALLPHSYDRDDAVRNVYDFSLVDIGHKQPALLLTAIATFLTKNPRLDESHKIQLLTIATKLVDIKRDEFSESLSQTLTRFFVNELISDNDRDPITEICQPASQSLVNLSLNHGTLVIDSLMARFAPGESPNYWLIKTLSDVARANPKEFEPRLSEVMSRVTPCLGNVKKPAMRWVFAAALGSFADVLNDARHNQAHGQPGETDALSTTREPSPSSPSQRAFEVEFLSGYEILFSKWLMDSPEPRLRNTILESLGSMSGCLERQTFETRVPKIIAKFLELYKKEKPSESLPITAGLNGVCSEAAKTRALESSLPLLLQSLHPMICRPIDSGNPLAVRNLNEQLRLIEILTKAELDVTLNFLVSKFAVKERDVRVGSLIIVRHLVNACDSELNDRRPVLMSALLTVIAENNDLAVKKAALQLMVAMANHGYFAMEGGHQCVRFIALQCALPVNENDSGSDRDPNAATPLQIRNAANHILYVLATKVPSCRAVMWPSLLEIINDEAYNRAINMLFKCVEQLANSGREQSLDDYAIDFEAHPELPRPQAIMARLFALLSDPYSAKHRDIGLTVCRAMTGLGPLIHPVIGQYWDDTVPALAQHLESHSGEGQTFNLHKWHDTINKVWRESLTRVGPEPKWLTECADRMTEQFKLYRVLHGQHGPINDPNVHRAIHRFIGVTCSKLDVKSVVERCVDNQWTVINHRSESERQGLAQGLGMAASQHLDTVLAKLNDKLSKQREKKSGFFASFTKDEGLGDEWPLTTIALAYGYIAAHSQPEQILGRIEVSILQHLIPMLTKAKTHTFRHTSLLSLELIARSVNSSRLPEDRKNFKLSQRDELLGVVIVLMNDRARKDIRLTGEMRMVSMRAAHALIALIPVIGTELRHRLLASLISYQSLTESQLADEAKDRKREEAEEANKSAVEIVPRPEPTPDEIETESESLMAAIIEVDRSVATALDTVKRLEAPLSSIKPVERQRASSAALTCLKQLIALCVGDSAVPHSESKLPELGSFLAMFVPRALDSETVVRANSVESLQALLFVDQLLANPSHPKPSQELRLLTDVKSRLSTPSERSERLTAATDLASIIGALTNEEQIPKIIGGLFSALNDNDKDTAQGAAFVLHALILSHNTILATETRTIVNGAVAAAKSVKSNGDVMALVHQSLRTLLSQHFDSVLALMLETPTPIKTEWIDAQTALVRIAESDDTGRALAVRVFNHLTSLLNDTPIDEAKPNPALTTATSMIKELCKVSEAKPIIAELRASLFCTLLMRIGMCAEFDKPSQGEAVEALKSFSLSVNDDNLTAQIDADSVYQSLSSPTNYDDGVTALTRLFCLSHMELKQPILSFLGKFLSSQSFTGQRVVATAMLATLVLVPASDTVTETQLCRESIHSLLPRVADKNIKVRKHALRGLGHLVEAWRAEISDLAPSILSSLTSASEDSDAEVAAESVASLTKIVTVVSRQTIAPMIISLCFRLRPAFDRKEDNVRASSFNLFAAIARFGIIDTDSDSGSGGIDREQFIEQVHINLPILIVHCNEDNTKARQATFNALTQSLALLDPQLTAIVSQSSSDQSRFDDLASRLAPVLSSIYPQHVRSYIDGCVGYLNSRWIPLRGAAAFLAASLVSSADASTRKGITVAALIASIIKLLDDSNAAVRIRAVKGLATLREV